MIELLEELNELLVNIYTVGVQSISKEIIEDIKISEKNCGNYKLTVVKKQLKDLAKSVEDGNHQSVLDVLYKLSLTVDILYKKVTYDKLMNRK